MPILHKDVFQHFYLSRRKTSKNTRMKNYLKSATQQLHTLDYSLKYNTLISQMSIVPLQFCWWDIVALWEGHYSTCSSCFNTVPVQLTANFLQFPNQCTRDMQLQGSSSHHHDTSSDAQSFILVRYKIMPHPPSLQKSDDATGETSLK